MLNAYNLRQKGFGEEQPLMQSKLEEFFNKYGKTNAVRMRRIDGKKEFKASLFIYLIPLFNIAEALVVMKGSVFVEFADASSVDAFLNADPKPSWNDEELLIMTKCARD